MIISVTSHKNIKIDCTEPHYRSLKSNNICMIKSKFCTLK